MSIQIIQAFREKMKNNIELVILGKSTVIERALMAMLCGGHILIEDIPGTGKTMLARSMAISLGSKFSRIQFTPDMLPSDVTGVSIFNQKSREFEFKPGPIMANIVLADEINRATPKTQSALLEAMEERQITIDGKTHQLPKFFMVIATQNPIEYEGTFNLPEAQLDRFMLRLNIGYPAGEHEIGIMRAQQYSHPIQALKAVASLADLKKAQEAVKKVHVSTDVEQYIVAVSQATRAHDEIYLGASPRASLALYRLGQCQAAFQERDFVIPDDIKVIAPYVLAHRLLLQPSSHYQDMDPLELVKEILNGVRVSGA